MKLLETSWMIDTARSWEGISVSKLEKKRNRDAHSSAVEYALIVSLFIKLSQHSLNPAPPTNAIFTCSQLIDGIEDAKTPHTHTPKQEHLTASNFLNRTQITISSMHACNEGN
jgi:hypothetical protein